MTGLVLSIIIIFGLPGGPTGDFNDMGATDDSVTASQGINPVQHSE